MDLEEIKDKMSSLPSWVWIAGAGIVAIIAFFFLKGSGGSSTTTGTGQTSDFTGALNDLSTAIGGLSSGGGSTGSDTTGSTGSDTTNPPLNTGAPSGWYAIGSNPTPVGSSPGDGYTWAASGPILNIGGTLGQIWGWIQNGPGDAVPMTVPTPIIAPQVTNSGTTATSGAGLDHTVGSTSAPVTPTPIYDGGIPSQTEHRSGSTQVPKPTTKITVASPVAGAATYIGKSLPW